MPKKTINVSEEVKELFDEWQFESRSRSQKEALRKLLELAGIKKKAQT